MWVAGSARTMTFLISSPLSLLTSALFMCSCTSLKICAYWLRMVAALAVVIERGSKGRSFITALMWGPMVDDLSPNMAAYFNEA
jgi:hypothetical protein